MSRSATKASLEEFARSGQLGPITLGLTRSDISTALGAPPDWLSGKPVGRSAIWKYGDVEIYFDEDNRVCLINFAWFEVPSGGPTLALSPWVIRQGLPLDVLQRAMHAAGIPFDTHPDKLNPECVRVITSGDVHFLTQVEGDGDELGLRKFYRGARHNPPMQRTEPAGKSVGQVIDLTLTQLARSMSGERPDPLAVGQIESCGALPGGPAHPRTSPQRLKPSRAALSAFLPRSRPPRRISQRLGRPFEAKRQAPMAIE